MTGRGRGLEPFLFITKERFNIFYVLLSTSSLKKSPPPYMYLKNVQYCILKKLGKNLTETEAIIRMAKRED
jgi:hypothetical protein